MYSQNHYLLRSQILGDKECPTETKATRNRHSSAEETFRRKVGFTFSWSLLFKSLFKISFPLQISVICSSMSPCLLFFRLVMNPHFLQACTGILYDQVLVT